MSCCSSVLDLGCFNGCDAIVLTGYNAAATGDHTFEFYHVNGAVQEEVIAQTNGVALTITANTLNEAKQIDFRVKQPNGTYYEFDTDVECGRVTTQIHY